MKIWQQISAVVAAVVHFASRAGKREEVRACLDNPEYVAFKEVVVKREVLDEVKDELVSINIKLYVEARRTIEDIGLSNPDEVLAHLGFKVKWKGLDMGAASIELP